MNRVGLLAWLALTGSVFVVVSASRYSHSPDARPASGSWTEKFLPIGDPPSQRRQSYELEVPVEVERCFPDLGDHVIVGRSGRRTDVPAKEEVDILDNAEPQEQR